MDNYKYELLDFIREYSDGKLSIVRAVEQQELENGIINEVWSEDRYLPIYKTEMIDVVSYIITGKKNDFMYEFFNESEIKHIGKVENVSVNIYEYCGMEYIGDIKLILSEV
jgi:hypothetical protein